MHFYYKNIHNWIILLFLWSFLVVFEKREEKGSFEFSNHHFFLANLIISFFHVVSLFI